MGKCFFKSLWPRETQVCFLKKKIAYEQYNFLGGHGFNILIQRNEKRFISLVLKPKQQKAIQLP